MPSLQSYDGLAPFDYPSAPKSLQTYYKVFGNLKSNVRPLVVIHGGPGFSHNYLLNHSFLTEQHDIPIILYDQIGSGRSTRLPETASVPNFWIDTIFFAQLSQLLQHLDIKDDYAILGSSWGGMMSTRFASQRPMGLKKLILANAPASKALSEANNLSYREALPQETKEIMKKHEEASTTSSEEYQTIMTQFTKDHVCNISPLPEDLLASIRLIEEDRTVLSVMEDDKPDAKAYLTDWDTSEDAKKIDVPVLLINGIEECASGAAVQPHVDNIPDVRLVTLEGTTHSPHFEQKEAYMKLVGDFLLS